MPNSKAPMSLELVCGAAILGGFRINGNEAAVAASIAMAESGGVPDALNAVPPDLSYGLWQINMIGSMGENRRQKYNLSKNEDLFDPIRNAAVAYGIRQEQGWEAWTAYKLGKNKAFFDQAVNIINNHNYQYPSSTGSPDSNLNKGDPILGFIDSVISALLKVLSPFFLRVAGFLGGIALIIMAIRLRMKGGLK